MRRARGRAAKARIEPRLVGNPVRGDLARRHALASGASGEGAEPGRRTARRQGGRRLLIGAAKLAVLLVLWVAILSGGFVVYCLLTLPDTGGLETGTRRPSLTVLARNGSVLATYGDLFDRALTLRQMAPALPRAVIAAEDRRFYDNFGVDPLGILRAALADLTAGHIVEGGSTITQQLAKNLFLTPARSLTRKVQEILLALWLDHRFTKDQILEIYLNRVYLGAGTYGVDAAAHRYFGRSARDLSLYESAELAGLLQAPSRLNPLYDPRAAAARTAQVLSDMVAAGFITAREATIAQRSGAVRAVPFPQPGIRYFTDWVAEEAKGYVGERDRDLTILTTLDPRLQSEAAKSLAAVIARAGLRARVREGALVAMTPDGAVRAMVGGRDYDDSQFNRATAALRQPGSAFKPFVFLAGLEAGLRPDSLVLDAPIRVGDWRPRDFGRHYQGPVTMAEGLAQSLNTVAVRVALRAGLANVAAVARRLGITSPLIPEPSLALGTGAVTLLDLVSAYAPFANGGLGVWPYGIVEIRDGGGKVLFRRSGSGPGRVVSRDEVGLMNAMLEGVVQRGTGRRAALPRPAAGKTGTTQDYRDAWFIGYTADLVAGVWLGNDDDAPMNGVTGGSLPAEIWHRFMLAATRGMPVRPLPGPPLAVAAAGAAPARSASAGGGLVRALLGLFGAAPPPSETSTGRGGY